MGILIAAVVIAAIAIAAGRASAAAPPVDRAVLIGEASAAIQGLYDDLTRYQRALDKWGGDDGLVAEFYALEAEGRRMQDVVGMANVPVADLASFVLRTRDLRRRVDARIAEMLIEHDVRRRIVEVR